MTINVNMTGVVKVNSVLHVRNRPSLNGSIIGYLNNGAVLNITQMENEWCYATNTGGWSHANYISLTNNEQKTVTVNKVDQQTMTQAVQTANDQSLLEQQLAAIEENSSITSLSDTEIIDSLIVENLNGIYGIPYQFMESVDPRLVNSSTDKSPTMGRKYADKIIAKMPLLCITPGKVDFMSNFSKSDKNKMIKSLQDIATGELETDINYIIKDNGRYYTFAFEYEEYFNYVNALCRTGARFLNIEDVKIDIGGSVERASNFDWKNALNSNLKATLTSNEFIGFYMDSTDSVSESFSNNTTQSQLSSTVNGFSDTARELNFLLGAGAGVQFDLMNEAKLAETMDSINDISEKYLNGNTLFTTIANDFATIGTGGKLLFPEIWSDSEFSRDFDVSIKLRTPDSDVMSWYINIFVPLCHLIALAAGHQTENVNGYYSPFLIRAFYKGLFNVDMGIVTQMSIRKGKEAAWNINGLPTEIDVDLTIKDLYNMLSIVPGTEAKNFVTNNILMDYVANTCGININQIDIQRSLEIYLILKKKQVTEIPNRIFGKVQDAIDTYAMDLYNRSLNKFLI